MLAMLKILLPLGLVGLGVLYFFQDSLIFFPQPTPPESREKFARHAYAVNRGDVDLHGWFIRGKVTADKPLVIYYGGNAEEVSVNLWDFERLTAGAGLFINYRGYGGSGGRPSQASLCQDALFFLDHVAASENIPLAHIVLIGRSLGSGVAVGR